MFDGKDLIIKVCRSGMIHEVKLYKRPAMDGLHYRWEAVNISPSTIAHLEEDEITRLAICRAHEIFDQEFIDEIEDTHLPLYINHQWESEKGCDFYKERLSKVKLKES